MKSFRSRILSINLGLFYAGVASGPLIANRVIDFTDGNIVSAFWAAFCIQAMFALYTKFIMVESLSAEKQRAAREKWLSRRAMAREGGDSVFAKLVGSLIELVRPLAVLKPVRKSSVDRNVLVRDGGTDWDMLLVTGSMCCLFMIGVSGC